MVNPAYRLLKGQYVAGAARDDLGRVAVTCVSQNQSVPNRYYFVEPETGHIIAQADEVNGANGTIAWQKARKAFVVWGLLGQTAQWKPGHKPVPDKEIGELETRFIRLSDNGQIVWMIDTDPINRRRAGKGPVGPKDSNFIALVRAVRGTGGNRTIARFPVQANYPLESQLSQLSTDGTKLFVIDATCRLRLYDLRGSVKAEWG